MQHSGNAPNHSTGAQIQNKPGTRGKASHGIHGKW